jgi:hypothetical protein
MMGVATDDFARELTQIIQEVPQLQE